MADESGVAEEGEDGSDGPKEEEMVEYELHRTGEKVQVRQLPSRGLSFQVWPAASALCWVLDELLGQRCVANSEAAVPNPEIGHIRDKLVERKREGQALRVLELGAGAGMVGIAAALLGTQVTVTDLPHVLPNLIYNASANEQTMRATGRGGSLCVKALRWGEMDDALEMGRNFDMVLASDVVYYDHLFEPLLVTLKWFLLGEDQESRNPIMLMAHLRRWKKDSHFFRKAKKVFDVRIVHSHPPLPGSRVGVLVYCFTNKLKNRAAP